MSLLLPVGAAKLLPMPTVKNRAAIKANFLVPFIRAWLILLLRSNIYLVFTCLRNLVCLLFVCITKIMIKEGTIQYIVH